MDDAQPERISALFEGRTLAVARTASASALYAFRDPSSGYPIGFVGL